MNTRDVVRKYRGSLGIWLGAVVVLALVFGPGVVDDWTGETLVAQVQAGAAVEQVRGDPGNVTVAWTSNQNADNLTVWIEGPADVAGPTSADEVVLDEVSAAVVFEEREATARNQTVTVWVEAAAEGHRAIIVKEEMTL